MAAAKTSMIDQPRRGRRRLLTADLQERICAFIRQGSYDYSAAEACGISRHTFFEWLARGDGRDEKRRGDRHYVEFARAVRCAQAEARVLAEIQIKKMDPKWWLSRMHRDRPSEPAWSNPTRAELPVDDDQPLTIMAIKRYLSSGLDQGEQSRQAAIDVESKPVSDGEPKR
jgi:hypothetical protein